MSENLTVLRYSLLVTSQHKYFARRAFLRVTRSPQLLRIFPQPDFLPGKLPNCPSCSQNLKNHAHHHGHRVARLGSVPNRDDWKHSLNEEGNGSGETDQPLLKRNRGIMRYESELPKNDITFVATV